MGTLGAAWGLAGGTGKRRGQIPPLVTKLMEGKEDVKGLRDPLQSLPNPSIMQTTLKHFLIDSRGRSLEGGWLWSPERGQYLSGTLFLGEPQGCWGFCPQSPHCPCSWGMVN